MFFISPYNFVVSRIIYVVIIWKIFWWTCLTLGSYLLGYIIFKKLKKAFPAKWFITVCVFVLGELWLQQDSTRRWEIHWVKKTENFSTRPISRNTVET